MNRRRKWAAAALVCTLLLSAGAAAQPATDPEVPDGATVQVTGPVTLVGDQGERLRVPAGYYFTNGAYEKVDAEMVRLQDLGTRLTAENKSLRKLATEGPGWGTVGLIAAAVAAGFAAGWAL